MDEISNEVQVPSPMENSFKRRKELLPWWVKTFAWIFIAFGLVAPLAFGIGLFRVEYTISLYGLKTYEPLSSLGLFLMGLFLFKAIIAYGLLTEKSWAVILGIIDAITGIALCGFVMFIFPFIDKSPGIHYNVRLELLILIPFLLLLLRINQKWMNTGTA